MADRGNMLQVRHAEQSKAITRAKQSNNISAQAKQLHEQSTVKQLHFRTSKVITQAKQSKY
jgi:hypothetical protein